MNRIIEVKDLVKYFDVSTAHGLKKNYVKAVDGVSFSLDRNETLAIVGESGSGKSVTALSIMGLLRSTGKVISGEILYRGNNLLDLTERELRKIRGDKISMVYKVKKR